MNRCVRNGRRAFHGVRFGQRTLPGLDPRFFDMKMDELKGWVPFFERPFPIPPMVSRANCSCCGHRLCWEDHPKSKDIYKRVARRICTYRPNQEEVPGYKFKTATLCGCCFVEWFNQNKDWLTMLELMEGDR